jgi:molybdate transport system ATP-binding protein
VRPTPVLSADLTKRLGAFRLDVSLTAEAGSTLVLVGESGAGKSTILNLLAGLLTPDRGRIVLDGTTYFDAERGIHVPTHRRSVAYVFQDYALFPHLSVFENAAFGLRAQGGVSSRLVRARVSSMLERLGMADLAPRRPRGLSGGQQQRLALARALVLEPALLLLDEPLAALDLQARREVRAELRRILSELPCVTLLVTHSPLEALAFGATIAVIERGRVVQRGTRDELLRHPRSAYVAELMGVNFFRGRLVSRDGNGVATVETAEGPLHIADPGAAEPGGSEELMIAVNPREITLHLECPVGTARNVFHAPISELAPEPPFGERVRVVLDTRPTLVAEVTAEAVRALGLREGMRVYASFKATGMRVYR